MKNTLTTWAVFAFMLGNMGTVYAVTSNVLKPVPADSVHIEDSFWSPKLETWNSVTLKTVLDKFEASGAFRNFDRVAGTLGGKHEGPPWFDGLIYETIRGASDFLGIYPDQGLEERLDGYIKRIARAQAVDPDGYIMTYTQLDEPDHRWGLNGGFLRFQHDVYNAGALVEAAVHSYRATENVDLLRVAVKLANHMCEMMGPAPKQNIIPAHALPEGAFIELYRLIKEDPTLKDRLNVSVDETDYLGLVEFWLEARGRHCGQPTSDQWDHHGADCEEWVRDEKYGDNRPCWGEYALYHSDLQTGAVLSVNGKRIVSPEIVRGYAVIQRKWTKSDEVVLEFPMQPRRVYAHAQVQADAGRFALQSGPLVYCVEEQDNPGVGSYFVPPESPLSVAFDSDVLGGVNLIKGQAASLQPDGQIEPVTLTAIPFYCQDNRDRTGQMDVWLPEGKDLAKPIPPLTLASQSTLSVSHCFSSDTTTALNDGVEPISSMR